MPNLPPAAPSHRAVPPALDAEALERLRQLDPDGRNGVLRRVLGAYEQSLLRMLEDLQARTEAPQAKAIEMMAHTLKSSSASVGALALAQACEAIERRVRAGGAAQRHDVEWLLVEGRSALASVRAMLAA